MAPLPGSTIEMSRPSPAEIPSNSKGPGPIPQRVQLKATELCWIRVILDDQPPWQTHLYPGDTLQLEAKERIRVLIGNAGGIQIKYNDEPLGTPGKSGQPIRISFPASTEEK
jgi:hypothetical protein